MHPAQDANFTAKAFREGPMTFMPRRYDETPKKISIQRADLLDHLADMAAEMKMLAQSADAPMLASMFDLAQREAREQVVVARARLRP
jgi:hypothetical protein